MGAVGGKEAIENQEKCGSCWAFSATEVLADELCFGGGPEEELSAQDLVSCDYTNMGCNGGILANAWKWMEQHGVTTWDCLPYTSGNGTTGSCPARCADGSSIKRLLTFIADSPPTKEASTPTSPGPSSEDTPSRSSAPETSSLESVLPAPSLGTVLTRRRVPSSGLWLTLGVTPGALMASSSWRVTAGTVASTTTSGPVSGTASPLINFQS